MENARVLARRATQGERPEWAPLLHAVGEPVVGDFMWMFEVELENGTLLQAYKHVDTRRYVHLDADGAAFVFVPRDRYRRVPAADVFTSVFASLPGLWGVTDEQIAASWAAVKRLRG